ncbi:restriction endonuclease subunit S [Flavobacterium sp. SLB02]|uniref:restriction endonuclease subunit S n=1 Tax=Flavobacterium sp. SLB02 TaxID=2665645 RepID=UPI0012A8175C|nr:restriction endonuclease subunit S [Flavobacterium sp. SLB02]QGK73195.1 hypothetical protein GIY83_03685 [Flavobacterium sp. SLB02]
MKDNWIQSPINEVTSLIKDGTHGTHKDFSNGIPMLSAKDIVGGKILIPDDARLISEADFLQIHKSYKLQENDVLLTLVGTIGRVAILRDYSTKFTFQRSVGILRFNERVNSQYAYYYISSERFLKDLIRSMNASAQGGVYLGELGKINISLPKNLAQQSKIAQILSACDAVIEKTESAIAKYQAIKQGLMHDLFTRGIDIATGKLRPKYEDAKHLYKESELGWIPKEWEVSEIGNILHIKHGYSFEGRYFSNEKSKYILLTPGNFNVDGSLYFQERNTKYYIGKIPEEFIFKNDDLLIVMTDLTQDMNILGNVVKLKSKEQVLHNQRIGKIETKNDEINRDYLLFILNSPFSKNNIKKTATGTTVRHTSPNHIYKGIIPIPNVEEQNKFVEQINAIGKKIQIEKSALLKYQQIKTGLMQDLLSGNVEAKI